MIKIDKSLFTADELAQYEALIAKAVVDPESAEDEMEIDIPDEEEKKPEKAEIEVDIDEKDEEELDKADCKKSADPALAAALERLESLEKSIALQEFTDIAKKYAPLGEKEDELASVLYDMKKSNEANYDAYIKVLDKSLGLVEKSGIFTEIGKSSGAYESGNGTIGKVEAIASDIMKNDPSLSREMAIAKAWEQNPELIAEYDKEYSK